MNDEMDRFGPSRAESRRKRSKLNSTPLFVLYFHDLSILRKGSAVTRRRSRPRSGCKKNTRAKKRIARASQWIGINSSDHRDWPLLRAYYLHTTYSFCGLFASPIEIAKIAAPISRAQKFAMLVGNVFASIISLAFFPHRGLIAARPSRIFRFPVCAECRFAFQLAAAFSLPAERHSSRV